MEGTKDHTWRQAMTVTASIVHLLRGQEMEGTQTHIHCWP